MAIQFIDLKAQRARLGDKIDQAVLKVVNHGAYIMGPEVGELERQLAAFCGVKHCVSCASGTDALLLVLMAKGIGRGDAVFVPAFTFVATAEVVALLGATPVFVDVTTDTYTMDVGSLKAAIAQAKQDGLKPAAVIPVDLFGQPADYRLINPVARAEGMFVLGDAAQSFGATLDGKAVGSLADATATSFFPAKPLGCYGDGGAVFTDSDELAALMRSIRVHGQGSDKYDNVRVGINGRLDTMQAAILLEKLAIFPDEVIARQAAGARYNALFAEVAKVPAVIEGGTSVWAQYTLVVEDRNKVAAACKAAGVPTAVYYPIPLSEQTGYRNYPTAPGGVPVSLALSKQVISLPMHPYLDDAGQQQVAAAVISGVTGV